jgi:Leucine-rich repeat (LRR) protein
MRHPLTPELIIAKTKTESLHLVKNLNLWGNNIDDLKVLRQMPNLEVLSLSVNKISTLKDFATCQKLQELYLRKNNITDITEVRYLTNLPNLKVLWLWDNPCAETANYREIVINALPNLVKLDNTNITSEEKVNA